MPGGFINPTFTSGLPNNMDRDGGLVDDTILWPPRWSYQKRSMRSTNDRVGWRSLWPNIGMIDGIGAAVLGDNLDGSYEPFSCIGGGTQSVNFLNGLCVDNVANPAAGANVQGFVTATDTFLGQVQTQEDGSYVLGIQASKATACYIVAYKAGTPDIAGTSVNTLLPTNVDGTP